MLQYIEYNENNSIVFSIFCALVLSFLTGVALFRNELLVFNEPAFKPFKLIFNIHSIERLNFIGEYSFYLGLISGLVFVISIRISKKKLIIYTLCLYNAIFISNAFILGSYQFLILKFIIGWQISISSMATPIYIQKQLDNGKINRLILLNALFLNIGLISGKICFQYNQILCRSALIFIIPTLFIRDPCKLLTPKCLLVKEVLNKSVAYCAIIVTTFYGASAPFLRIVPLKNDKLFYEIRVCCLVFNIFFINYIDRRLILMASNLLVVIMTGLRMAMDDDLNLRESLIWAYSAGMYPVSELLFTDLYPKKYSEFGLFLKSITGNLALIGLSAENWNYKKAFISSVFLMAISAFIYTEPFETMEQAKKW